MYEWQFECCCVHNARINVCCDVSAQGNVTLVLTYVQIVAQGFVHQKAALIRNYSHTHHTRFKGKIIE
jgi:hypothetical protein